MFQSAFSESVAVKEGKRPTIELKEDDADAMDTILRVLHYKSDNLHDDVGPMTIALVAIHADKYQLQGSLKPWVSVWFHERGLDEESPPGLLPHATGRMGIPPQRPFCKHFKESY